MTKLDESGVKKKRGKKRGDVRRAMSNITEANVIHANFPQ